MHNVACCKLIAETWLQWSNFYSLTFVESKTNQINDAYKFPCCMWKLSFYKLFIIITTTHVFMAVLCDRRTRRNGKIVGVIYKQMTFPLKEIYQDCKG